MVALRKKENYSQITLYAFRFSSVSLGDVKTYIMNVDVKKSSLSKSILAEILKQSAHLFALFKGTL